MLRPLPTLNTPAWSGALIALFGALILLQWWMQLPSIASNPYFGQLRLHAGLMLMAGGLALAARSAQHAGRRPASRLADACALLMIIYPALVQSQTLFGINLGLDFVRVPLAPTRDNPYPGRMAPNGAVAFMSAGLSLWLLRKPAAASRWPLKTAIGLLTLVGFSALTGYLLGLEQLYRVVSYNVMLLPTAVGVCLLAAGLWRLQSSLMAPDMRDPVRLERHMALRALATLAVVALASGGAAFAVMRANFVDSVIANARTSAHTSALALENTLQTNLASLRAIASRPDVVQSLATLQDDPDQVAVLTLVSRLTQGFIGSGIDGVRFLSPDRRLLAQAGELPAQASAVVNQLQAAGLKAELRWQGSYVLHAETPVEDANRRLIGFVVTEQRLWLFDQVLSALIQVGDSADALVCSRTVGVAVCAPSRLYDKPYTVPMFDAQGRAAFPMSRALLGETGAMAVKDLRGIAVVAGYAPVGELGIGLVVKNDVSALYAPLKERLHLVVLLVIALVGAGAWILRAHVRPLMQAVLVEQQRTRTILDTSSDAFIALGVDGRITDWNAEATRLFGWREDEAVGRPLAELIVPPAYRDAHSSGFARFVQTGSGPVINRRTEITGCDRDGREIPIELSISAVSTPDGYVANAFVRDIRARREAQQRLEASERRLHDVLNNIPAMVGHFDAQERCLFANDMALKAHGLTLDQAVGQPLRLGISAEAYELHKPHIGQVLRGHRARFEGFDVRNGTGTHYQANLTPEFEADGTVSGFYLMNFDVSELKQAKVALEQNLAALRMAERRMAELALSDPLTGLANRRRFNERLAEALARARRQGTGLGLLFLDIDRFKPINDTFGHAAGDAVLIAFGARLQAAVRVTDFVARLAGDEFVVILEGVPSDAECERVAAKIEAATRQPITTGAAGAEALTISASIGIAYLPGGHRGDPASLLALADRALYETKARGRDGHTCLVAEGAVEADLAHV
jgi:diguanylate cyclase (GGDEF)-like protein/PAS domain S-box-containing protein